MSPKRKSKISLDLLRQQAADGATVSQAARALGVSITSIVRRASSAGIVFPTKSEASKRRWAGLDGQSVSELSKRTYEARVRRIVREELATLFAPLEALRPPHPYDGDAAAILDVARQAAKKVGEQ